MSRVIEITVRNNTSGREIRTGRIIARYSRGLPGPCVILLCGIHGNENAGVFAAHDVISYLKEQDAEFRGEVIAIAGNIPALGQNTRYIDADLNRIWTRKRINGLIKKNDFRKYKPAEYSEQKEIFEIIRKCCVESSGPVYMFDLHTTSAESVPFIFISDTIRNREFVRGVPLPVVLGVEEMLKSTLLNFANHIGIVCFGLEAGSHHSESSYHNTYSTILVSLYNAGCVVHGDNIRIKDHFAFLVNSSKGTTDYFKLIYRYEIQGSENFIMKPGFINFQQIKKGQHLAESNGRKIESPENGKILMPLYQKQGNDGFYIVKEINRIWIDLSGYLRKTRLNMMVSYIPFITGLKKHPELFAIRRSFFAGYFVDLMHLFGYRKKRELCNLIIFGRREFDIEPPKNFRSLFRD